MKLLFTTFIIAILTCSFMRANSGLSSGEQMGYRIMGCFAKKMKKEKGLQGIGFGGSSKDGKRKVMSINFKKDEALTVDFARKLSVETVNEFVSFINNQDAFRREMIVYPFTEKNVCILISGQILPKDELPYVKMVAGGENHVWYFSTRSAPPNFGSILDETFEEAERILNEQKNSTQQ